MTANEEKVLKIIKDSKGKTSSLQIARELKISSGYTDLLLKALQRKEKMAISGRWVSLSKKELAKAINPRRKRAQLAKKPKRPKRPRQLKKPKRARKPRKPKRAKKPKAKRRKVERPFSGLKAITEELKKILLKAGYKDKQAIAEAPLPRLMEDTGIELKQAANLINKARGSLKIVNANVTENNPSEESPELESSNQGLNVPSLDPENLKNKNERNKSWLKRILHRFFG